MRRTLDRKCEEQQDGRRDMGFASGHEKQGLCIKQSSAMQKSGRGDNGGSLFVCAASGIEKDRTSGRLLRQSPTLDNQVWRKENHRELEDSSNFLAHMSSWETDLKRAVI